MVEDVVLMPWKIRLPARIDTGAVPVLVAHRDLAASRVKMIVAERERVAGALRAPERQSSYFARNRGASSGRGAGARRPSKTSPQLGSTELGSIS